MIFEKILALDPELEIEKPPRNIDADYAIKVFKVAKREKRDPREVAIEIANKIKKFNFIKEVQIVGPYINFKVNWREILPDLLKKILDKSYFTFEKKNLKVLIEHTSANPNKALHIGHLRNFALGDSLAKLLNHTGYDVQVLYYVDDTGLQVADTVLGFYYLKFPLDPREFNLEKWLTDFEKFLKEEMQLDDKKIKSVIESAKKIVEERISSYIEIYGKGLPEKFDQYSTFVYVIVNKLYQVLPELERYRRLILKDIEKGRGEVYELSKKFVTKILKAQLETLWKFDTYFDLFNKESDIIHFGFWDYAFDLLKRKGIVKFVTSGEKAGTWCIDLSRWKGFEEVKDGLKVLVRSDGTTVYLAKDIGYALWKHGLIERDFLYKEFIKNPNGSIIWITDKNGIRNPRGFGNADISINVIGREQAYLQKIISKIIEDLSEGKKKYVHYSYELVMLSNETAKILGFKTEKKIVKMSTRRGLEIDIDSLLDRLKSQVIKEFKKRGQEINEEKALKIAVSVLRYEMIKLAPEKPLVFKIEKALSLEENSAIYLLYSYARANSIIKKAKELGIKAIDIARIGTLHEKEEKLVKKLMESRYVIEKAAKTLKLNLLADYIYELSLAFNEFYQNIPVLKVVKEQPYRLTLVKAYLETAKILFHILGILPIEKF